MERGSPRRVRPGFLSLIGGIATDAKEWLLRRHPERRDRLRLDFAGSLTFVDELGGMDYPTFLPPPPDPRLNSPSGSRGNVVMHRAVAILLVLIVVVASGCASTSPPQPTARPFENLRQLVVVASGDTTFAVTQHSAEPGRTFDEILKWGSLGGWWWKPAADLAHRGINWLLQLNRKSDVSAGLGDVSPREMVATAFASTLRASGQYDEITTLTAEPSGDDRRSAARDRTARRAGVGPDARARGRTRPSLRVRGRARRTGLAGAGVVVWKRPRTSRI